MGAFGLLWLLAFLGKTGMIPVIPSMNINLFSQIGLVLLIGLVTKNSILLVEYAIEAHRGHPAKDGNPAIAGMSRWDALMDACHKRARPIIMTSSQPFGQRHGDRQADIAKPHDCNGFIHVPA